MLVNNDAETNQNGSDEVQRLTLAELRLVKVFRLLNEEHRKDVLRFIEALLSAQ